MKLNLLLHGMHFVLDERDGGQDGLSILLPKAAGHSYLAGAWRGEQPITATRPNQPCVLSGVAAEPRRPALAISKGDSLIDANLQNQKPEIDRTAAHCILRVPYPDAFLRLKCSYAEEKKPFFDPAGTSAVKFGLDRLQYIAEVYLLQYELTSPSPAFDNGFPPITSTNCHIFAACQKPHPTRGEAEKHLAALNAAVRAVFSNLDLKLAMVKRGLDANGDPLPAGITAEELESLDKRHKDTENGVQIRWDIANCDMKLFVINS